MGNGALIGTWTESPDMSFIPPRLEEVAAQIADDEVLRQRFMQYFKRGVWIETFLQQTQAAYATANGDGLSDIASRKSLKIPDQSPHISYLTATGTYCTVDEDRSTTFYTSDHVPTSKMAKRSKMLCHMSNRTALLPLAVACSVGAYIQSRQYILYNNYLKKSKASWLSRQNGSRSPHNSRETSVCDCEYDNDEITGSTVHHHCKVNGLDEFDNSSSDHRSLLISTNDETVYSDEMLNDEMMTSTTSVTESVKRTSAHDDDNNKFPEHNRLRGLLRSVIECTDSDLLDHLLVSANDMKPAVGTDRFHFSIGGGSRNSERQNLPWPRLVLRFLDTFPAAITIASTKRNEYSTFPLIYVNKLFEEVTQHKRADILGHNCRFLVSEQYTELGQQDRIRDALHDMRYVRVGLTNVRRNGTPFYNLLSLTPAFRPRARNSPRKSDSKPSSPTTSKASPSINNVLIHPNNDSDKAAEALFEYSHVIGITYDITRRTECLSHDLQVVEDLTTLLGGLLIM